MKIIVDADFKDDAVTLAVLARDAAGEVQRLWFEKASFHSAQGW